MTTKIARSNIPAGVDFDKVIVDHLDALEHWRQHMANVAKDPGSYQPYPAPVAPHMVEQALRKDRDEHGVVTFVPDYEIFDDGPTSQQNLQSKKNHLVGMVSQMELVASASVFPLSKRRWTEFMVKDAEAKKPEERSPEEVATLEKYAATKAMLTKVARHGAMLHSAVEDLTEANVDSWQPAEFPK